MTIMVRFVVRILFFGVLLALCPNAPAFAQAANTYYTYPTIASVKALQTRPAVVEVVDSNPGIFNWSATPCSAADDIFQITPTAGPTGCYTRMGSPYAVGNAGPANGVLSSNGTKVPSFSTTLPTGLAMQTPASINLSNASALPITALTGLGTNVATSLGVNVGSAGAFVVNGGAGGTPSSLTLTNATGLPNAGLLNSSVTINGSAVSLGGSTTVTAVASSIAPGTTTFSPNTNPGGVVYNNAGVVDVELIGSTVIAPHVATNAALIASATTTYSNGVWRDDYASGIGAPTLFYQPQNSCPYASGNDNGLCVASSDSKSWVAQIPSQGMDVREWGAQPTTSNTAGFDSTAAFNSAVTATCSYGALTVANLPFKILVPAQQYRIATSVVTGGCNNVVIEGVNKYDSILWCSSTTVDCMGTGLVADLSYKVGGFSLRHISLEGPSNNKTAGILLNMTSASQVVIEDVSLLSCWNCAYFTHFNDVTLRDFVAISQTGNNFGSFLLKAYNDNNTTGCEGGGPCRSDSLHLFNVSLQANATGADCFVWDGFVHTIDYDAFYMQNCSRNMWVRNTPGGTTSNAPQFLFGANMQGASALGHTVQLDAGQELHFNGALENQTGAAGPGGITNVATVTASISGFTMNVTAISGTIYPGSIISVGAGVTGNTFVTACPGGVCTGTGNYTVSISQTVGSESMTIADSDAFLINNTNVRAVYLDSVSIGNSAQSAMNVVAGTDIFSGPTTSFYWANGQGGSAPIVNVSGGSNAKNVNFTGSRFSNTFFGFTFTTTPCGLQISSGATGSATANDYTDTGGATTAAICNSAAATYFTSGGRNQAGANIGVTASSIPLSGITGFGSGIATALAINTGSAGAPVLFNGAAGTPSSITLTNATGLPNGGLTNSTISGVSLGGNLFALTFGTHLSAGGSSYNGSAATTITSDATSANTASTLVARDGSGNFSAGTITATGGIIGGSGGVQFITLLANDAATVPAVALGSVIGTNYSNSNGETNFWNTYSSGAVTAFDFRKVTGVGTSVSVALIGYSGGIISTGGASSFAATAFSGLINPNSAATLTCGTGCASVTGNPQKFTVTTGTAQTSVIVNFGITWPSIPVCALGSGATASVVDIASKSTTAITLGASVALTATPIDVICF